MLRRTGGPALSAGTQDQAAHRRYRPASRMARQGHRYHHPGDADGGWQQSGQDGVGIFVEKLNPAMRLYRRLGFVNVQDADISKWNGCPREWRRLIEHCLIRDAALVLSDRHDEYRDFADTVMLHAVQPLRNEQSVRVQKDQ